jgi:hypothetical protein
VTACGAGASQLAVLADGPAEDPAAAAAAVLVLGAGGETAGRAAWRLAALLDAGFLAGAGWDPVTWVLSPPAGHRLIRWDCGRLDGPASEGVHPRRDAPSPVLGPGKCAVVACLRAGQARRGRREDYCRVHVARWDAASQADPLLDERRWRQVAEPLPVPGQVNLRGLAPLVVVEVLYGLQQRAPAARPVHELLPVPAPPCPGTAPVGDSLAGGPARPGRAGPPVTGQLAAGPPRAGVRRPADRDHQGQVGPDRPGSPRLARLHRHQPAVAA